MTCCFHFFKLGPCFFGFQPVSPQEEANPARSLEVETPQCRGGKFQGSRRSRADFPCDSYAAAMLVKQCPFSNHMWMVWNPTHKNGKHGDSLLLLLVIWSYIWGGRTSTNPNYLKIHPIARVLTHSNFMMQEMPTRLSLMTFWWSKSLSQ